MAAIPVSKVREAFIEYTEQNGIKADVEEFMNICTIERFDAYEEGKQIILTGPAQPLWETITELGGKWRKSYRSWAFSIPLWKAVKNQLNSAIGAAGYELKIHLSE